MPRLTVTLGTVLAIAAIVLTVWEGLENRRHNRLSVAPRVDGYIQLSEDSVGIELQSTGLGPAVIKTFQVFLDGSRVYDAANATNISSPWQQIIQPLNPKAVTISANALGIGTLLRAGQDFQILQVAARDSASVAAGELGRYIDRIGVRIRYCSMYDDQCRTTYVGIKPLDSASSE